MYSPSLTERPRLDYVKPPLIRQIVASRIAEERTEMVGNAVLTVVVVAYNEREQLLTLLKSVLAQSNGRAAVMLVDNGLDADIKAVGAGAAHSLCVGVGELRLLRGTQYRWRAGADTVDGVCGCGCRDPVGLCDAVHRGHGRPECGVCTRTGASDHSGLAGAQALRPG